MEVIVGQF